jgi:hypothetical protein
MRSALDPGAAAALVADDATVMIGGFMGVGSPHRVIAALVERGARGLTVIANDTARPGVGIGKLITAGCVARVIASHIGTNPETQRLMLTGQLAVELVPQGTFAERIRAGGAGLGGVLTATGIGTLAAEGRQVVQVDGREFLVEPALKRRRRAGRGAQRRLRGKPRLFADCAQLQPADGDGSRYGDRRGERNRTARCVGSGCCPHAGRADRPSDRATARGVTSRTRGVVDMTPRELIARRVARELRDDTLVNLGIGLPTMVAQFVPAGTEVYFQSENGIIGFGARPPEGMEDLHLTDAGGAFVSALPGAVAFDSAMSFALIRGGHLDMTGTAAAGGIALVNCIGNLGGFVGPYAVGWIKDSTGDFSAALYFLAGSAVLSAVITLIVVPSRKVTLARDMAVLANPLERRFGFLTLLPMNRRQRTN